MELENTKTIHSSEKCEVVLGEADGKQYIKKTGVFSREAVEKTAKINSPYIARITEIGDDYIITEYADGEDLARVRIAPQQVYEIALELCDALSVLHENSVIHRDVKPSNIILCNDGHIKLIDFDAARIKNPHTDKDTRFIGTDGFAPPEQYGFSQTDERSDIYSLGITLKILLGKNYNKYPHRRVIEKCMRFNPDERYNSVKAVKAALITSRRIPLIALITLGAAVIAALILALNLLIDHNDIGIEENESSSDFSSEFSSFSTSSSISSINSSTSTSRSSSTSSSTSSTTSSASSTPTTTSSTTSDVSSTTLSISSTTSSTSSANSSTSSTTSSASSPTPTTSSTISSTTSSTTSTAVPEPFPENERSYTISWDLTSLPDGFPRLTDNVTRFSLADTEDGNNRKFFLYWNVMPEHEVQEIVNKIHEWMGDNSQINLSGSANSRMKWELINSDYQIEIIFNHSDVYAVRIEGIPKSKEFDPQLSFSSPDPTVIYPGERNLKWEQTLFDKSFPKLTDYVTSYKYRGSDVIFEWNKMTVSEAEYIVQKIVSSFQGEYKCHCELQEKEFFWSLKGEIGGKYRDILVLLKRTDDGQNNNNSEYNASITIS